MICQNVKCMQGLKDICQVIPLHCAGDGYDLANIESFFLNMLKPSKKFAATNNIIQKFNYL